MTAALGRSAGSLALVALLAALSRVPAPAPEGDGAALRFSWRFRAGDAADCRRPTQAELEELPVHMRNPDACIGDLAPYELEVLVDGTRRLGTVLEPMGVRGDRPIFVYEELRLPPGRYGLTVRFGLQDGESVPGAALSLDTTVVLQTGQVLLVTRSGAGDLEVRRPTR